MRSLQFVNKARGVLEQGDVIASRPMWKVGPVCLSSKSNWLKPSMF